MRGKGEVRCFNSTLPNAAHHLLHCLFVTFVGRITVCPSLYTHLVYPVIFSNSLVDHRKDFEGKACDLIAGYYI